MALTFDNGAGFATAWNNISGLTSARAFTVGAGSGRIILAGVSNWFSSGIPVAGNVGSATYNGVAMTRLALVNDGIHWINELWYLTNPASGSNNVQFHFMTTANLFAGTGVMSFAGADQAAPFSGSSSAGAAGNITTDPIIGPILAFGNGSQLGLSLGGFQYANTAQGPPDSPNLAVGGIGLIGSVGYSSGLYTNTGVLQAGYYTVGSYCFPKSIGNNTQEWTAHDGGGYNFGALLTALNPFPSAMIYPQAFFDADPSALQTIETCDYGN